jgi:hypothetical protein
MNTQETIIKCNPCLICKETAYITVPTDGYMQWLQGTLIQDAFPDMSVGDRETLISGIHPGCWEILYPADKEEDVDLGHSPEPYDDPYFGGIFRCVNCGATTGDTYEFPCSSMN